MVVETLSTLGKEGLDFPKFRILVCLDLALRFLDRPAQDAHVWLYRHGSLIVVCNFKLDFKSFPSFLQLDAFGF